MKDEKLPPALVPDDCDLRDFPFMPVDIMRLFNSEFHARANDAEWRAGMTLWLKSYHQVPAASIPDDDISLARLAEFGRDIKSWKKVRDMALHGWVKCDDGRLYHPVVAEKVLEAWIQKIQQRLRSARGNAKRYGLPFDETPFITSLNNAYDMLRAIAPSSKYARACIPEASTKDAEAPHEEEKEAVLEATHKGVLEGVPEGVLEGVPQASQETGTGTEILNTTKDKSLDGKPSKPLAPEEIIFSYGVPMLTNAGTPEKQARSFLGGLRKQHGDIAVVDKLRECLKAKPLQPLEWLAAALPPPKARGQPSSRAPQRENFEEKNYGEIRSL